MKMKKFFYLLLSLSAFVGIGACTKTEPEPKPEQPEPPVYPSVDFQIHAVASGESAAEITITLDFQGDSSQISEYGFIYGTGETILENGRRVVYPFAEKGSSFTETVDGLNPEKIVYGIIPCLKFRDGEEIYGEQQDYIHYWEKISRVIDIDGNEYPVICSGERYWMAADLRVTHYNDGTAILNILDNVEWTCTDDGAYCYYDNDRKNAEIYGALYNFAAVETDKLCPKGWSVPTSQEWKDLAISQGGKESHDEFGDYFQAMGIKFKSDQYWKDQKPGKNTFGFNGVPGGCRRFSDGLFNVQGQVAYYWSSERLDRDNVITYYLRLYNFANVKLSPISGFSVRCIRDKSNEHS